MEPDAVIVLLPLRVPSESFHCMVTPLAAVVLDTVTVIAWASVLSVLRTWLTGFDDGLVSWNGVVTAAVRLM